MSVTIETAVAEVIAANRMARRLGQPYPTTECAENLRLATEQWAAEQAAADAELGIEAAS